MTLGSGPPVRDLEQRVKGGVIRVATTEPGTFLATWMPDVGRPDFGEGFTVSNRGERPCGRFGTIRVPDEAVEGDLEGVMSWAKAQGWSERGLQPSG